MVRPLILFFFKFSISHKHVSLHLQVFVFISACFSKMRDAGGRVSYGSVVSPRFGVQRGSTPITLPQIHVHG